MICLDYSFTHADFKQPIECVAVESHVTFGCVRHFLVGLGTGGKLLSVHRGVGYRDRFYVQERLYGEAAPREALDAAHHALTLYFLEEWERPICSRVYDVSEADEAATSKEIALNHLRAQVAQRETPAVVDMYERAAWSAGATVAETEQVITATRAVLSEVR